MIKKIVLFLVRRRLKLKKYEPFQFVNQKNSAVYYFTEEGIIKAWHGFVEKSGVSLNWMLDDECEIRRVLRDNKEEKKEEVVE